MMNDKVIIPKSGYILIDSKLINGDVILNEILNRNQLRVNNVNVEGAILNQDEILLLKNLVVTLKMGGGGSGSNISFSDLQFKIIFKLLDKFFCHETYLVLQLVKSMLSIEKVSKQFENYIQHVYNDKFNLFKLIEKIINTQISIIRNNRGGNVEPVYGDFISTDTIQIFINMFKFYQLPTSQFYHLLINNLISRPIFLNSIIKTFQFHCQNGNLNIEYSKSIIILFLNISIYLKENKIDDSRFIDNIFQCLDIILKFEKKSELLYVVIYQLNLILINQYKSRDRQVYDSIKNSLTTREVFIKSDDKELIEQIDNFLKFYKLEQQQ